MLHILGYAAIAVAGGAVGYWLKGKDLEENIRKTEKLPRVKEKEETKDS